jgi:hypothetical protein
MDFPICSECNRSCNEVRRNFGRGLTEYWGAVSYHENWQSVSDCCYEDLIYELEDDDGLDEFDELPVPSASGECGQVSVLDDSDNRGGLLVPGTP